MNRVEMSSGNRNYYKETNGNFITEKKIPVIKNLLDSFTSKFKI